MSEEQPATGGVSRERLFYPESAIRRATQRTSQKGRAEPIKVTLRGLSGGDSSWGGMTGARHVRYGLLPLL